MSTSTGNTKYGSGALQSNSTIDGNNSAFGIAALGLSTEKWNTAVGAYSGFATTSGISNTSVGTNTLLHNTSGNYNTALGTAALCVNTLGTGNTAVGSNSLEYSTTGGNNTIIGTQTGGLIVTGSNNICLGYKAGTSASSGVDYSNCIVIGNNIFPTASAQAIIGDGTQTSMNLVCSTNPTMSGYALPLSTDASNKIATCAWVQTAVGGGGTSLIPLNNTWTGTNTFLTITSTAAQPEPTDTSTIIPTTDWVQGAITAGATNLTLANNTWNGTNTFLTITSTAAQPLSNDSSTKIPTTSWVQGAITAGGGGTNLTLANNTWTGTNTFLTITSTAAQPEPTDTSTIIPTTDWVQGAITAGATNLTLASNTWTGTNAFNNAAPITSTAAQPLSNDSSTKIPTTSWVQGAITSGLGAKMPLAGGTFTGTVYFTNPYPAVNYKRNMLWTYGNDVGLTYTPTQTNSSNHDFIRLSYNNACTIDLVNLNCDNDLYWQDGMRTVTITKNGSVLGGFIVTVLPPAGYTCYDITNSSSSSLTIGAGVFSATYQLLNIYWSGGIGSMSLISQA